MDRHAAEFRGTVAAVAIVWRHLAFGISRAGRSKNFSLYFSLDRPQYLVVLTDHSLDALSEMR
jgi:hypothetical protein